MEIANIKYTGVKKVIFSIIILTVCSSCIKTYVLKDGYTKVPVNDKLYKNPKFSADVFKIIDTNSIYIDTFSLYRFTLSPPKYSFTALRFYSNGLYNRFKIDNNRILLDDLGNVNLNFKETGSRGYYYYKDNELQLVSFGSENESYTTVTVESKIILTVDGLLKQVYRDNKVSYFYKKRAIPEKWKNAKPSKYWE